MIEMRKYRLRITHKRFDELLRHVRAFRREAERCQKARAYYSGLAMLAAALEGSLVAMCVMYPDEATEALNSSKRQPRTHVFKWDFATLIMIAKHAR
jgi:hypothetical protein